MNEDPNKSIVVRGVLSDPRHIELAEPVTGLEGAIEVEVRPLRRNGARDVYELIAALRPGVRSKDEIDRQVREDRDGWADR